MFPLFLAICFPSFTLSENLICFSYFLILPAWLKKNSIMDFNAYLTLASSSDFKAATGIVYLSTMVKITHHTHFQASLNIPWELTRHQFSWRLPPHKLVNICSHLLPVNEWIHQWHLKLHFYCACYLLYRKGNKSGRKDLESFHFSYCTKTRGKILIFWWASVWNCFLQLTVVNLVIRANFQLPSDFCL